jgi:hypothetical protein
VAPPLHGHREGEELPAIACKPPRTNSTTATRALLTNLVRSEKLTAEDRDNLRKLLDELTGKARRKGK